MFVKIFMIWAIANIIHPFMLAALTNVVFAEGANGYFEIFILVLLFSIPSLPIATLFGWLLYKWKTRVFVKYISWLALCAVTLVLNWTILLAVYGLPFGLFVSMEPEVLMMLIPAYFSVLLASLIMSKHLIAIFTRGPDYQPGDGLKTQQ